MARWQEAEQPIFEKLINGDEIQNLGMVNQRIGFIYVLVNKWNTGYALLSIVSSFPPRNIDINSR